MGTTTIDTLTRLNVRLDSGRVVRCTFEAVRGDGRQMATAADITEVVRKLWRGEHETVTESDDVRCQCGGTLIFNEGHTAGCPDLWQCNRCRRIA